MRLELQRQLPDRRRLSGPVHPDDQDHARLAGEGQARRATEQGLHLLGERILQLTDLTPLLEPPYELCSRRDADVAPEERLLEPFPRRVVARIERRRRKLLGERAAALRQRLAHPREDSRALRLVGRRRLVAQQLSPGQAHDAPA